MPYKSPEWLTDDCFLKKFEHGVYQSHSVLIDDYLVVLVHSQELEEDIESEETFKEITTLYAYHLKSGHVQEVKIEDERFTQHVDYTLLEFKENQIIKLGGQVDDTAIDKIDFITVESFEPFKVSFKEVSLKNNLPDNHQMTPHVYQDCLYDYGSLPDQASQQLWTLDQEKFAWKLCETTGAAPDSFENSHSFIHQDNLYLYQKESHSDVFATGKDMFVLNFGSMEWTKIEQKETIIESKNLQGGLNGVMYHGCLLLLGNIKSDNSESDIEKEPMLCCWNINTNTWSTYAMKGLKFDPNFKILSLFVFNDTFFCVGELGIQLTVSQLSLDGFDLAISKSSEKKQEQERIKSLFLKEEQSDICFKVQNATFPAHKEVLLKKSRFFANLLNSGMTESRQDTLEIHDCDQETFQEFLRWIYCGSFEATDDIAMKLLPFTDKYLESSLRDICLEKVVKNLNFNNVHKVLNFAVEQKEAFLQETAMSMLIEDVDECNLSETIKFLNQTQDSEFSEDIFSLKEATIQCIIENYGEIALNNEANIQFFEEFLIKNIEINNLLFFAKFVTWDWFGKQMLKNFQKAGWSFSEGNERKVCEHTIANIRKALYNFVNCNIEKIKQADLVMKELPSIFWANLVEYTNKSFTLVEKSPIEEESGFNNIRSKTSLKRKEPVNSDEENSELKKTKKTT